MITPIVTKILSVLATVIPTSTSIRIGVDLRTRASGSTPPPSESLELRQDGGIELRQDGGYELRQ